MRIGTQEISRYGWNEKEMFIIAEILRDIRDNVHLSQDISQKINTLSANKKYFIHLIITCMIYYILNYITVNLRLYFSDLLLEE